MIVYVTLRSGIYNHIHLVPKQCTSNNIVPMAEHILPFPCLLSCFDVKNNLGIHIHLTVIVCVHLNTYPADHDYCCF